MNGWLAAVLNLLGMGAGAASAQVVPPPNFVDFDVVASPGPFALDMTVSRVVATDLAATRVLDFDGS